MSFEKMLPFIQEIDRLKTIERQTLIHSGGRRENSAEHSWHLALSVLVMEKFAPEKIDATKAVKMALLHDLVEIDAGDVIIYGDQTGKKDREETALYRLMGLLPADIQNEWIGLWKEFEAAETAEAKFVAALDRFLPLYSNFLNEGYSWQNHNVSYEKVIEKCRAGIERGSPELWKLAESMIENSVKSGILSKH